MKALCLTLAMFVSGTAAARTPIQPIEDSGVIAQYAVHMDTRNDGLNENGSVYGVLKVKTDGTLSVDKYLYTWSNGFSPEFLGNVSISLHATVQQRIKWDIIALSNAKVKVTHSDVVCMMMPMPGPNTALLVRAGYTYDTESFTGALRTVETNTGCWASSHTSLENEYDRQTAASLMSALNILALQLAN